MGAGRFTVFGGVTALKNDFPGAAALFAECFTRPTFPEDEFAKMQQLALGAIAQRADDPQSEIGEFFFDSLPAASPFHVIQGGTAESVKKLAAKDLKEYHAEYFTPDNMIVTVFGDIGEEAALLVVKKLFGDLQVPPRDTPPHVVLFSKFHDPKTNAIAKTIERRKQISKPTAMVMLGYPTASIFEKEDYASMTVLGAIMAGYHYPGGWLHNELRGEGLVYYVHASQMTGPVPGYFIALARLGPTNSQRLSNGSSATSKRRKKAKSAKTSSARPPNG